MESRESGRNEESLTSVAGLKEILRCATIDMPPFEPIPGPSLRPAGKGATLGVAIWQTIELKSFLPNNVKDHVRLPYQFPINPCHYLNNPWRQPWSVPRNDSPLRLTNI